VDPAPVREANAGALPPVFAELEQVLAEEAHALRRLDRAGIERAAEAKAKLCDALADAQGRLTPAQRPALERLRKAALRNHMLLAHARDSVRQVLSTAAGRPASGRPSSPVLGGLRLDMRG
jgi:flagellar biosynthesis/type III secretory pathway chaperone